MGYKGTPYTIRAVPPSVAYPQLSKQNSLSDSVSFWSELLFRRFSVNFPWFFETRYSNVFKLKTFCQERVGFVQSWLDTGGVGAEWMLWLLLAEPG